ncbi:MAG: phosphotransferase [Acidimicrobiales bacterium]
MFEGIEEVVVKAGIELDGDALRVEPIATLDHSTVARVRLSATRADAPPSLIYKHAAADSGGISLARREVRFYREIADLLPAGLVPRYFVADESDQGATLLLEDLSISGRVGTAPPSRTEAESMVTTLARLHGAGAGMPTLPAIWSERVDTDFTATAPGRLSMAGPLLELFLAEHGADLDAADVTILQTIGNRADVLAQLADRPATILHGDAHYANAVHGEHGATLIDFGSVYLGPGEFDLAHAVAMNLPRATRLEWETSLIDGYRRALDHTVGAPAHDVATNRYRLGVLNAVVVPVTHWIGGVPPSVWRPLLDNALGAARDHDAVSLLT